MSLITDLFLVLPVHPLTLAVIGIFAMIVFPRTLSSGTWIGISFYLLLSFVTATEQHGWGTQMFVLGQLFAWAFGPGSIIVSRVLFWPDEGTHWMTLAAYRLLTLVRPAAGIETDSETGPGHEPPLGLRQHEDGQDGQPEQTRDSSQLQHTLLYLLDAMLSPPRDDEPDHEPQTPNQPGPQPQEPEDYTVVPPEDEGLFDGLEDDVDDIDDIYRQ